MAINLIIKSLPDELGVAIAQDVTDEALLEEFFAGFEDVFQNWDPEVRTEFETTVRASFSFLLEDIRN